MPSTTRIEFGDVVLVPFPFTDLSWAKRRPAVVVSSDALHRIRTDVIALAVTSRTPSPMGIGDAPIAGWREAFLKRPSYLKPTITTIERELLISRLGRLRGDDLTALRRVLREILGL